MDSRISGDSAQVDRGGTRRGLLRTLGTAGALGLLGTAGCVGQSSSAPAATTTAGEASTATTTTTTTSDNGRTVTDATGRSVVLPATVDEVVAVGPGALNLVAYLDALDAVVGVEQNEHSWSTNIPYNIANPALREKPVIGPHKGGDPELIADADPDVVLATYMTAGKASDLQSTVNLPVVVVKASGHPLHRLEQFYTTIAFVGEILGRSERAKTVTAFVREEIGRLDDRTADIPEGERDRVFLAGRSDSGGAGVTSTQHPFAPFAFVNAANVAESISGHAMVSKETLLTWDPGHIFVSESNLDRVLEALATDTYAGVAAIESGNLYGLLPSRFYGDLYGSVLANAYYVGSVLYPDRFEDVDPAVEADRIYEQLVGAPVYAELASKFGGFDTLSLE